MNAPYARYLIASRPGHRLFKAMQKLKAQDHTLGVELDNANPMQSALERILKRQQAQAAQQEPVKEADKTEAQELIQLAAKSPYMQYLQLLGNLELTQSEKLKTAYQIVKKHHFLLAKKIMGHACANIYDDSSSFTKEGLLEAINGNDPGNEFHNTDLAAITYQNGFLGYNFSAALNIARQLGPDQFAAMLAHGKLFAHANPRTALALFQELSGKSELSAGEQQDCYRYYMYAQANRKSTLGNGNFSRSGTAFRTWYHHQIVVKHQKHVKAYKATAQTIQETFANTNSPFLNIIYADILKNGRFRVTKNKHKAAACLQKAATEFPFEVRMLRQKWGF